MCTGIALAASDVPLEAVERYSLSGRLHERGGEREFRFLFRDKPRLLPIIHDGHYPRRRIPGGPMGSQAR